MRESENLPRELWMCYAADAGPLRGSGTVDPGWRGGPPRTRSRVGARPGSKRPGPTCPGEERCTRPADQTFRPPKPGSVHMVHAPDCGGGNVARSQARVRAEGRNEGAPPIGPGQGHRGPGGTSRVDSQDRADATSSIRVAEKRGFSVVADAADERRAGAQARHLEREVRGVATRDPVEPGDLAQEVRRANSE